MTREEASLRQRLRTAERRVKELEDGARALHAKLIEEMAFWENGSRDAHAKGETRGGANMSGMASGFAIAASRVRTMLLGERV